MDGQGKAVERSRKGSGKVKEMQRKGQGKAVETTARPIDYRFHKSLQLRVEVVELKRRHTAVAVNISQPDQPGVQQSGHDVHLEAQGADTRPSFCLAHALESLGHDVQAAQHTPSHRRR